MGTSRHRLRQLLGGLGSCTIAVLSAGTAVHAQQWQRVQPSTTKTAGPSFGIPSATSAATKIQALQWEPVQNEQGSPPTAPTFSPSGQETASSLQWHTVSESEVIKAREAEREQRAQQQRIAAAEEEIQRQQSINQPIRGGLYQIKRGEQWLPSISQRVPQAYGSPFMSLQTGIYFSDCGVSGGYVCGDGTRTWQQEFSDFSENDWLTNIGLGDPIAFIGIDLGITISSLATTRPGQSSEGTPFGSGQGLNLAISRNLGPNTAIKIGAFNLWELDEVQYDAGQSAYGVFSTRFDLDNDPANNSNDLYVTIGAANGIFRPLNVILADQEAECTAEVNRTGRRSKYKYGDYCNKWGLDWGSPYPVASVAYMFNSQLSMMAEWWGRNLTLAASIKPFSSINWVITPGITSLIPNADWDPQYQGYTERVRFVLTTSIAF